MATLPSPTQVAGQHSAIYEAYYNVVDPKGVGSIGGMEAARFLKRSGLSDVILSKIWDLSDPGGRGCLDKSGMFVALKLVALVQNGKDLSVNSIHLDVSPPKMGDIPLPKPQKPPPPSATPLITSLPPTAVDWSVKATEKEKYEKLFDSLQPINGLLAGNKVKNVLLESKLPFDTLGKIWDLADQDKDGMLDRYEFIAAMHLVYKALDKFAIPNSLPIELMPPTKRKNSASPAPPILNRGMDGVITDKPSSLINQSLISTAPVKPPAPPVIQQTVVPWVVNVDEKAKSDALFIKSDVDKDGFVSGQEIKDVFLQSGVPQAMLAHIWALCDIKQSGKLNNEQFALAMWFVARCLKGIDPPTTLTPEMVPPSFRSLKADGLVENNNTKYSNPELEMISKDIEQLSKERLGLEAEITQKEADIRIKKSEITSLQSELDTLAATLKQLENQKGEAQKRLNDLKAQVDKLRTQASEQAALVSAQESELNSKKQQLEGLKQEEERLENELTEATKTLDNLTTSMQDSQLNISQAKALQTQLEEQTRQLTDAIKSCEAAINANDASQVPDTTLRINPDFRNSRESNLRLMNGPNGEHSINDTHNDPFSEKSRRTSGFEKDPFNNDPFNNSKSFTSSDAFSAAFGSSVQESFSSDPFGENEKPYSFDAFRDSKKNSDVTSHSQMESFSSDPFGENEKQDPFDAFRDSRKNSDATSHTQEPDKDPFGCDPFAILHAPTRDGSIPTRPTSPSPALPPKKSKQPPPRPAPPRPQPPKKSSQNDPFGGDSFGSSGSGFADFSDFDSKCLHYSFPKERSLSPDPFTSYRIPYCQSRMFFLQKCSPVYYNYILFSNKTSPSSKTSQVAVEKPSKELEFVDDPFRDYRYEDPFNISFEEDESPDSSKKSKSVDAFNTPKSNNGNSVDAFNTPEKNSVNSWDNEEINRNKKDFEMDKFDPFGLDGRQSVPLPSNDLFNNNSGRASAPIQSKVLTEDQQLAWAAAESLRLEKERQQRLLQEEADLKLALTLSQSDVQK
ncbi:epidermal growth factor receptor substrate 15-like 1 isoform X3 [Harmonia axyridis]|uniref:epidermal growth factor receptor substrate 15-like 1 isoform X3 n=1 Tax=Harmonia axyridis TaxID=115357 RepID=UPI001E2764B9|nr:epidermal growth factor receptor substrate 15-like 1 isoform X3 [Harmonia axyridis]